jgi:hypothetical protein
MIVLTALITTVITTALYGVTIAFIVTGSSSKAPAYEQTTVKYGVVVDSASGQIITITEDAENLDKVKLRDGQELITFDVSNSVYGLDEVTGRRPGTFNLQGSFMPDGINYSVITTEMSTRIHRDNAMAYYNALVVAGGPLTEELEEAHSLERFVVEYAYEAIEPVLGTDKVPELLLSLNGEETTRTNEVVASAYMNGLPASEAYAKLVCLSFMNKSDVILAERDCDHPALPTPPRESDYKYDFMCSTVGISILNWPEITEALNTVAEGRFVYKAVSSEFETVVATAQPCGIVGLGVKDPSTTTPPVQESDGDKEGD